MNLTKKVCFLSIVFFLTASSFAQETYTIAIDEYEKDNYQKAVELFTQAIEKKENLADAYKMRGASNTRLGKPDEAKADLDMAFKLNPEAKNLMYFFGLYYLVKQDGKSAIPYLDKAIAINPKDDESYSLRGGAYSMIGDYENALKDGNKSVQLKPNEEQNYTNRGYTKLMLKKYEEAIEDFNQAILIKPTQKAYANKGYAYALMGMQSFAITSYTKSLDIVPNDHITLYYRGCSYETLGKFDEACNDFMKAESLPLSKEIKPELDNAFKRIKCVR